MPFVGGGGVPRQFSCAMMRGCSSSWSSSSFDGEGSCCLCLWALIVLHGCLWAVVTVCALFEVDGGADPALPHTDFPEKEIKCTCSLLCPFYCIDRICLHRPGALMVSMAVQLDAILTSCDDLRV